MSNKGFGLLPIIVVIALVLAVAGGAFFLTRTKNVPLPSKSPETQKLTTVKVGNGPQTAPDSFLSYVTRKYGFDKKHGIELVYETNIDPGEVQRKFQAGEYNMTWGPTLTAAKYITDGKDVVIVGPKLDAFMVYLTRPDAKYTTIPSLKGTKFGVVSKITSSYQLSKLQFKYMGLDLEKDFRVVFADFPNLNKFLLNGEIDFYPNTLDAALKLIASKQVKEVAALNDLYKETNQGRGLPFILFYTNKSWMDANPGVAQKMTQAYLEGINYIKTHPEIYETEKEYLKISTDEEMSLFKTRYNDILMSVAWDQQSIDNVNYLIQQATENQMLPKHDFSNSIKPL